MIARAKMRVLNIKRLYLNVMLAQMRRRLWRVMNTQCARNRDKIRDLRYVGVCVLE